jgi:hypothetical protein
MNVVRTEECG